VANLSSTIAPSSLMVRLPRTHLTAGCSLFFTFSTS